MTRLRARRFWTDYLHFSEPEWPSEKDVGWELPFGLGSSIDLKLEISYGASLASLTIYAPSKADAPIEVAWDDQAHWHPHVFRWPELQNVCQRIAARSNWSHPGIPLLLLYRFAPITSELEYLQHSPAIYRAWDAIDLFTRDEVFDFVDRVDYREQDVHWYHDATYGWTIHQADGRPERNVYSCRVLGNDAFPFVQWNALMSDLAGEQT